MPYSIRAIDGLAMSPRRSIVFLLSDEEDLNAASTFDSMNVETGKRSKQQRTVLDRFDFWISGGVKDNWFHGWPNDPKYANCFTFKWNFRSVDQRLYGFLCNPRRKSDPRFQLCVLHVHREKVQWSTEPRLLDSAVKLSGKLDVMNAIRESFPDSDAEK
jgi:hypothetical protein